MLFRPQDLHSTRVYVVGVDYSLVSQVQPFITTLPLQGVIRDIYNDIGASGVALITGCPRE